MMITGIRMITGISKSLKKMELRGPKTRIHNRYDKPIFLIPISCPDGAPLSRGLVRAKLVKKIPAGEFIQVVSRKYNPKNKNPRCQIYILFRAGENAENVQEFLKRFQERYPNGVEVEGELRFLHNQLKDRRNLYLNCDERGQVTVEDEIAEQISLSGNRLRSGMEHFRKAQKVRLWNLHNQYLVAKDDQENVFLGKDGSSPSACWSVEFVPDSDSVLRLKSCYGKYLAASNQPSLVTKPGSDPSPTSCKVLQSLPPLLDSSLEWEPVMEATRVKLRTRHGSFLNGNFDPVTHDFFHSTVSPDGVFWDVFKSEEEGSATKRPYETGEGSSVTKNPQGDSGLTKGGDLVGLHGHKERLIKLLLKDNAGTTDVLVRGGSGMTALVRKVCEDVHTRDLFDTIAWISVPQKYDSELTGEEILLQLLFENAPFPNDFDVDHEKVKYFTNSSEHNKARCLIVVDNLVDPRTQKTFEEVLRLVKTYKVIFMARRNSPINTYGRLCEIYEQEDLCVEESWAHFRLKKSTEGDFPPTLKEVCQLLVRKFESLPGSIVLHLRNREERNIERKSMLFPSFERNDEWAPIILPSDDFPSFNLIRQVLEILYTDDRGFCLLYLSIFPENSLISCKRLSRLWAAEGFLPDLGEAEGFFIDLLDRKCIHPVEEGSDGELSTFRVDNLVREIIVSLSDRRNLVTIISQGRTNLPIRVRHLSVQGTIRALNEEKHFQVSSIFPLDVSSNEDETITSEASPLETSETSETPFSKVLDLTGAPFQIIPEVLFELFDPSCLCLRNTPIKAIPGSIRKFTCLKFLDAKHSLVTELPGQVAGLKKIRHILIYHHEKDPLMERDSLIGFKALCRVGELKCLEKLCFVEADKRTLKDLGKLTKLRRLGITKLKKGHGELLCTSLAKLKKLKSLNLHALDEDGILDLHYLSSTPESPTSPHESESPTSPPKSLKHLYLHGRLEKLPDWISSPNNLTIIMLRWSQLEEDPLAKLGVLRNLVELKLRRAYKGERMDFKEKQFPKLKILLLDELEGLRSMSFEQGTLPSLEELTISRCQRLERIPSGIEDIPTIRNLTFLDMSHEFYDKVRVDHEKDGYKKFEHIKEVYFTRWRASHWEPHQVESTDEADCSHQVESTDEAHCSHQVESTDGIRLGYFYLDL